MNRGDELLPPPAMARRASGELQARILLFVSVFLGITVWLANLSITEGWHWALLLAAFGFNALFFSRTGQRVSLGTPIQYAATFTGGFQYLNGGIWETVGLATISGVLIFAILGAWIDFLVARRDPESYALLRKIRDGRE